MLLVEQSQDVISQSFLLRAESASFSPTSIRLEGTFPVLEYKGVGTGI